MELKKINIQKLEKLLIFLCSAFVLIYFGLRAAYVPIFHDEAATFFHFIQVERFIPFYAEWDAGNHLLNSALSFLSVKLFGMHPFWLRLPNLICLPFYLFFCYRISGLINHRLIQTVCYIAMITATMMLEFFSQARGYGMSLTFFMATLWFLNKYLNTYNIKHQITLWVMMFLTLLANMSMVNTLLILCGMIPIYILSQQSKPKLQHFLIWLFLGLGLLAITAWYAFEMKSRNLLYTGLPDGFVEVTVYSFAKFQFGLSSLLFSWILAFMGLFFCSILLWKIWTPQRKNYFNYTLSGLLLLNAIGAILLNQLLAVNYPEERTAIYFLPLFILAFAFAMDQLVLINYKFKYFILPLLFFPIQLFSTLNLNSSRLWAEQHIEKDIFDAALQQQQKQNMPLRISMYHMHAMSWAYQSMFYNYPFQIAETTDFPDQFADLMLIRTLDYKLPIANCDTIYFNSKSSFLLLKPLLPSAALDTIVYQTEDLSFNDDREFFDLIQFDSLNIVEKEFSIFEFTLNVNTYHKPVNGQIVIVTEDHNNQILKYDFLRLQWIKKYWEMDEFHFRRSIKLDPETKKLSIYYWNMGKVKMKMQVLNVRKVNFTF